MKAIRNPSTSSGQAPSTGSGLGKRGVTLIEVVAALGIIAVGILGLLTLFPLGLEASARAGDRTTAAILGEYVIEQVRLRQDEIATTDNTAHALDALDWGIYEDREGRDFTFEPDNDNNPAGTADAFGTGEQIVKQLDHPEKDYEPDDPDDPNNGLSDQDLFSRYEVTLKFENVSGFASGGLMQVTVTMRWPRAFSDEAREKQDTMTFVTYIRPGA